jgi:hypothetical protein
MATAKRYQRYERVTDAAPHRQPQTEPICHLNSAV